MIINDETYEKLKMLQYNLEIITDHPDTLMLDGEILEYEQWHSHLLIFTDILEKIKDNRVIIFGDEEDEITKGGMGNINNYICHENLRQVYISLKYLVSIDSDVIYSFEAQTFKNICHFFEIDIPEEIDINKRDNLKKIILFINNIFVERYLSIKQNIIENQIYSDWEKEDITNFFKYYDIYTTIKDYQNIIIEINKLMDNDSYDLNYCIKQLWGSVESLDFYVEQFFKFKYNDKLILSHEGIIFNSEVYISKITEHTLLQDDDKILNCPKKKTVLLEDIIKYIENGKYNKETLKEFIDYLNNYIEQSIDQSKPFKFNYQQSSDESTPFKFNYQQSDYNIMSQIPAYGGSQSDIKKHSRKKK
jgi:hypothetical protein